MSTIMGFDPRPLYRCRKTGEVFRLVNAYEVDVSFSGAQRFDFLEPVDGRAAGRGSLRLTRSERCKRYEAVREVVSVSYEPCRDLFALPETPPNSAVEEDCG